jgi:hypothetical protein
MEGERERERGRWNHFDYISMKTMQTYVDTIEGLFKEFQEQKKTKS